MTAGEPPAEPAGGRPPADGPAASSGKWIWVGLGAVLIAVSIWGAVNLLAGLRPGHPAPEVLGSVPDFNLTERAGGAVTRDSLLGHVWIADFIYTRCTGLCPLLSTRMRELQDALEDRPEVRLVSFSVDPQYDTTSVLSRYATAHGADPARWLFLTGDWEAIRELVGDGFHLSVSQAEAGTVDPGELVTHSDKIVLVDKKGRIRGYYDGTEEEGISHILADVGRIAGET